VVGGRTQQSPTVRSQPVEIIWKKRHECEKARDPGVQPMPYQKCV
jgi:hypothetical protein